MQHRLSCRILGPIGLALLLLSVLVGVPKSPGRLAYASPLRRTPIVKAVEAARPSVVNIQGRKTVRADQSTTPGKDPFRQVNGMGTGIIIDERGYILTNYHVVEDVEVIHVTLFDRQSFVGKLVSNDPVSDLAIIKIDADKPLETINIGVSTDLMPGEPVIAVGNAFGYENTVTRGIISALHREVQVSATQRYRDLIQTDASINPGNSGGPLLNIDGEMIGINVAVRVGAQGIGFAIPVDEALEIAAQQLSTERSSYIDHGIVGETRMIDTRRFFVVSNVRAGSVGSEAGLRPGDVVQAIGQKPVRRRLDFERIMLGQQTGESLPITVQRGSKTEVLELALAAARSQVSPFVKRTWDALGLRLSPLGEEDKSQLNSRYHGGMRIDAIRPEGPAARQGIQPGDILVGMHIWETVSEDNVLYILEHEDFSDFQPIKFFIVREHETLYGHLKANAEAVARAPRRRS